MPKVQKIAQSDHTVRVLDMQVIICLELAFDFGYSD